MYCSFRPSNTPNQQPVNRYPPPPSNNNRGNQGNANTGWNSRRGDDNDDNDDYRGAGGSAIAVNNNSGNSSNANNRSAWNNSIGNQSNQNRINVSAWNQSYDSGERSDYAGPPPPKRMSLGAVPDLNCPRCDNLCKKITVKKDNENKGRPFYTCSNDACKYFKWADENYQGSSGNSYNQNRGKLILILNFKYFFEF